MRKSVSDDPRVVESVYQLLFHSESWATQRIENFVLRKNKVFNQRISITLDWVYLTQHRSGSKKRKSWPLFNKNINNEENFYLPIGFADKKFLINFDLRGGSDEPMSLLPAQESTEIAVKIFSRFLAFNQVPPHSIPDELNNMLLEQFSTGRSKFGDLSDMLKDPSSRSVWERVENITDVAEVYNSLARKRLLIAVFPASQKPQIIKYSQVIEYADETKLSFMVKLGWASYAHAVRVYGTKFFPLDVVVICSPAGLSVRDAEVQLSFEGDDFRLLWELPIPTHWLDDTAVVSLRNLNKTVTDIIPDDSSVSGAEKSLRQKREIILRSEPTSGTFLVSSTVVSFLLLALITIGYLVVYDPLAHLGINFTHSETPDSGAAITLLTIIPSLAALFLAAPSEHPVFASIHGLRRGMLSFSAVLTLILSFVYSAGVRGMPLHGLFLLTGLFVLGIFVVFLFGMCRYYRAVRPIS